MKKIFKKFKKLKFNVIFYKSDYKTPYFLGTFPSFVNYLRSRSFVDSGLVLRIVCTIEKDLKFSSEFVESILDARLDVDENINGRKLEERTLRFDLSVFQRMPGNK